MELYNAMTGERDHKFKLLLKSLDEGDGFDIHRNYRFPVIIREGEEMYFCMPKLYSIR